MNTVNTHQVKDMVGEILQHNDEVTFQANGGEQTGTIMEFKGLFVRVKTGRGEVFIVPPNAVMTDRGADRIVRDAEAQRTQ